MLVPQCPMKNFASSPCISPGFVPLLVLVLPGPPAQCIIIVTRFYITWLPPQIPVGAAWFALPHDTIRLSFLPDHAAVPVADSLCSCDVIQCFRMQRHHAAPTLYAITHQLIVKKHRPA